MRSATTRKRRGVTASAAASTTRKARKLRGGTDAFGFRKLLAGILRSKLYDIKATYSTTSPMLSTRLVTSAYDAVMTMGRELKPEFVEGKQQLLEGRRCPRCLQPQHRIRIVRMFDGRVEMFSCMECKHMISMQVQKPPEVVNA